MTTSLPTAEQLISQIETNASMPMPDALRVEAEHTIDLLLRGLPEPPPQVEPGYIPAFLRRQAT